MSPPDAGACLGAAEPDRRGRGDPKRNGVDTESVRRWNGQSHIDRGSEASPRSDELAEIQELKAMVCHWEEDNDILRRASVVFARGLDPGNR